MVVNKDNLIIAVTLSERYIQQTNEFQFSGNYLTQIRYKTLGNN